MARLLAASAADDFRALLRISWSPLGLQAPYPLPLGFGRFELSTRKDVRLVTLTYGDPEDREAPYVEVGSAVAPEFEDWPLRGLLSTIAWVSMSPEEAARQAEASVDLGDDDSSAGPGTITASGTEHPALLLEDYPYQAARLRYGLRTVLIATRNYPLHRIQLVEQRDLHPFVAHVLEFFETQVTGGVNGEN